MTQGIGNAGFSGAPFPYSSYLRYPRQLIVIPSFSVCNCVGGFVMAVGLYAALLGIWLIVLSLRVIALRGNPAFKWFGFGNFGDVSLQRAIRGHGNLIEYAPIFLILLYFVEASGFSVTAIHWYGSVFVLGRLMHGVCFGFLEKNMFLRVAGTVLTLFPILGLSVVLLLRFI